MCELAEAGRRLDLQRGVAKAFTRYSRTGRVLLLRRLADRSTPLLLPVRPGGGLPPMAIFSTAARRAYMVSKEFLLEKVLPRLIALVHELETSLGTAG